MKKSLLLLLVVFVTATVSAQSRQENYKKAQDLMRDNKDKKAIDHLTKCISKDNTHAEYFYLRSTACMNIGDGQGALRDMDFAIKFGPDSAKYYYQRGRIYLLYRRPSLTIKDANEGLKVSKTPKDSSLLYSVRAKAHQDNFDTTDAEKDYNTAIQVDPNNYAALNDKAMMINSWPGRGQEAIGLLWRAAKADTSFILVYSNLGFTYAEMNKHDSAIIMYNDCIRRMPNSAYAYSNRSYSKLKTGDLKGAREDCEKSIKLNDTNSWAYRNLGLICIAEGSREAACSAFEKALLLGFTEQYGGEVRNLQKQHCKQTLPGN